MVLRAGQEGVSHLAHLLGCLNEGIHAHDDLLTEYGNSTAVRLFVNGRKRDEIEADGSTDN